MKKELIDALSQKFEEACYLIEDTECWSARELQAILGYAKWDNFLNAIGKAKESCLSAGEKIEHHFADVGKMIDLAKGAQRRIEDLALTRYDCYLIAQNGDPTKKPEIAFAQTYFAVQTRKQEHVDNNLAVRRILQERGVKPEHLPPSEDVRKVERRLKTEEKKAIQKPDKIKALSTGDDRKEGDD